LPDIHVALTFTCCRMLPLSLLLLLLLLLLAVGGSCAAMLC
jgi:hypothetical protein